MLGEALQDLFLIELKQMVNLQNVNFFLWALFFHGTLIDTGQCSRSMRNTSLNSNEYPVLQAGLQTTNEVPQRSLGCKMVCNMKETVTTI